MRVKYCGGGKSGKILFVSLPENEVVYVLDLRLRLSGEQQRGLNVVRMRS